MSRSSANVISVPAKSRSVSASVPHSSGGDANGGLEPSGRTGTMPAVEQLGLSPFSPGQTVTWWDERGRRTGRFVGVITRGRHRGDAEVALGGAITAERLVRVAVGRLSPVESRAPGRAPGSS